MEKKQIIYCGTNSRKTWDQCVWLLDDLTLKKVVHIATFDRKKYEDRFFKITGFKLKLEKIKDQNNIYTATLNPQDKD